MKNLSEKAFHKVCKLSFDSKTHKIEQFYKGVWGNYPTAQQPELCLTSRAVNSYRYYIISTNSLTSL